MLPNYDIAYALNKRISDVRFFFLNDSRLAATAVSEKQKNFAISIARDFVYNEHSFRSFNMDDLEMFLKSDRAMYYKFWIDCKPDRFCMGAIPQKIAVEKAIAQMKAENRPIASLSQPELKRRVSRL